MASIAFEEGGVPGVPLADVRKKIHAAAQRLNEKRKRRNVHGFATVYVTDILVHPGTRRESFVVTFSDTDITAQFFVRRALTRLTQDSKERTITRLEHITARWFHIRDRFLGRKR